MHENIIHAQYKTFLLTVLALIIAHNARSQNVSDTRLIEITTLKTSTLIFPAVIKSVDRGTKDVLAQKARGVENVLHLKAARMATQHTNLTVITSDGAIYEMTISFKAAPNQLVYDFSKSIGESQQSRLLFDSSMTETELENYARQIASKKKYVRAKTRHNRISMELLGAYIHDDVLFFHLRIRNRSFINYNVQMMRFFIQDRTQLKRTSNQEIPIKPLWVYGNPEVIKGKSSNTLVYALPKFTIPDAKKITWELFEDHGGRNLHLHISNRRINQARPLDTGVKTDQ